MVGLESAVNLRGLVAQLPPDRAAEQQQLHSAEPEGDRRTGDGARGGEPQRGELAPSKGQQAEP
jgi:hypothetical protein